MQVVCKKVIAFILDQERPPAKKTESDRTEEKETHKCSIIKSEVEDSMILKKGIEFFWDYTPCARFIVIIISTAAIAAAIV